MVTLPKITVCPWGFSPRASATERETLTHVTKEDILGIIEPVSADTYVFDNATFVCKNWQSMKSKGLLSMLLSKSRCTRGERIPNKTTYLFVYIKDGVVESIITNDRHWKKERTIDAFEAPRHNILVIKQRLEKENYSRYAEKVHELDCQSVETSV